METQEQGKQETEMRMLYKRGTMIQVLYREGTFVDVADGKSYDYLIVDERDTEAYEKALKDGWKVTMEEADAAKPKRQQ